MFEFPSWEECMKRLAGLAIGILFASVVAAQQSTPTPGSAAGGGAAADSAVTAGAASGANSATAKADFIKAADEVLGQMSEILDLPVKEPLKKSLRSKAEIRTYLIQEEKEERTDAERYADEKSLEAFGLIPKNFPLDSFMLDILTDQVAGLYDPKAKEFYIADWIEADEQKPVMAHELTHALEDQSFHIDPWIKGARPNDDAELARDSVSEGSALAAMVDYTLKDDKLSVRDLPDVTTLIRSGAVAEMSKDPKLSKAPPYIQDELLFPYLAGTNFSQQFLKAHTGWSDLKLVFENPPVSTQQILHPDLYLKGVKPHEVKMPSWNGLAPSDWKLLEENVLGEFGFSEVLKQLIDEKTADALSPAWAGDRYALFENQKTKNTALVLRLVLDSPEDAAHFFGEYSEALENKYSAHTELFRRPTANFFQFQTEIGGVYLRCVRDECLTVEGASRETYDKITAALGWPPAPAPSASDAQKSITQRMPERDEPLVPAAGSTAAVARASAPQGFRLSPQPLAESAATL
jgi:hypothetical protein